MRRVLTTLTAFVVVGLVVASCGSNDNATVSPAASASSTTSSTSVGPAVPSPGSAPDVANATDLMLAPAPSAGTAPAPTSLVSKDLVVGKGVEAKATSSLHVQYVGANYADGKVFDSSWQRGQPADFPVNGVIPGFAQGIVGMKVGGRRELVIPPDQGYGAAGQSPAVGPNETLVFVIDLLGVTSQ